MCGNLLLDFDNSESKWATTRSGGVFMAIMVHGAMNPATRRTSGPGIPRSPIPRPPGHWIGAEILIG